MRKLCFLIILASLLISVFSMSVRIKKVEGINGNWWDPAWSYRRKLNITENSGYDLTSFPVDVVFEHDGNVKADGTDIRVVDGSTEIPSYVEECNSTHAKVIFEVDLLALESKIVYIYYGNQYAIAPSYPLVSLTITEGNTGHAIIDNSIYIGWDYTSWGWSNNVELWNDFRIDFNENNDPTDDNDLIRDYGSRQGGIARHRLDLQAIGLGNYQAYVQTPIYVDIEFADASLRVYRNHNWVETTQADHLFMFSTSWDYANFGLGSEQNIIDGKNVSQISPSPPWHYPWNEMYISPVNPRWMAYRDSLNGEIFGSIGLNIGIAYNYLFTAKEGSDWDRCIFYDFILDSPIEPYDQPIDCRIYWYGDNSNNYIEIEKTAAILNNQPTINIVKETITVPDDYPTIQEAINNAGNGDTIFVRNGTYYENVVVNKTVSLIGENKDTTIIDGKGVGHVVQILANNTLLSNFTIQNGGYNKFDCGVLVSNSFNSSILNNAIINNNWEGLRLYQSSRCLLRNNNISNNAYWNFGVTGTSIEHFIHDIDDSNTINRGTIYYLINQHNLNISNLVNVGYLAIINSSNINVEGLVLRDNFYGIQCVHTTNSIIRNVSITRTHEAIYLKDCPNITVRDSNLNYNWHTSITSQSSPFCRIFNNNAIGNQNFGFVIGDSPNSSIYQNLVGYERYGIYSGSPNNSILGNTVCRTWYAGIWIELQSYNSIIANNIVENNYYDGIRLYCDNCIIFGNNITNNYYGLSFIGVSGNRIFHNNFINNKGQIVWANQPRVNTWDDGYPSGGNYWSDYTGVDLYSGSYQNETGSDGIGDAPYIIDEYNQDNYPLMKPYPWGPHDIGITSVTTSKTIIGQGYDTPVEIMMFNYGNYTENFNITVYANETIITEIINLEIASRNYTTLFFTWNTTGFAHGNYTIWAYASPVPEETDILDNTKYYEGIIKVTIPGDVDGDFKVKMDDIIALCNAFGSTIGQPKYDPNLDINNDNKISMDDIMTAVEHFGQHYP